MHMVKVMLNDEWHAIFPIINVYVMHFRSYKLKEEKTKMFIQEYV